MTYKIIHKNSTVSGTPPTAGDIDVGELAINAADAELYTKDTNGVVRTLSANTFTQSGTGAVQRTVESKLQDVVSIKDFGAVGDGVADDTVAIQAALNSGKLLDFGGPENVYVIKSSNPSSPILLLNNSNAVVLKGSGATIKIADDSLEYQYILSYASSSLQFDYVNIEGLVFDCNKDNLVYTIAGGALTYRCDGIKIKNASLVRFANLVVKNVVCANFLTSPSVDGGVYTVDDFIVENCKFENVGDASLALYDTSIIYTNVKRAHIKNNIGIAASMGVNGARTFIEIHAEITDVSNNYCWGFENGILVTGITLEATSGVVFNNDINVSRNGIWVLGDAYGAHTSGLSFDGLVISGNKINIDQSNLRTGVAATSGGIICASGSSLAVKNIHIADNVVEFKAETSELAYTINYLGIGFYNSSGTEEIDNISIASNAVINCPMQAYCVGFGGGIFSNVTLSSNVAINPGQTLYSSLPSTNIKVGLYVQPDKLEGSFNCTDLVVIDNQSTSRIRYAFNFNVGNVSTTTTDVYVSGTAAVSGLVTTSFITPGRLSNTNVSPRVNFNTTKIGATSTTGSYAEGSSLYDSVNNIRYTAANPGSLFYQQILSFGGSAAPSVGTWSRGDIVFDTSPTAGDYVGWVCTAGGSPGTWKTFGAISA